MAATGHEGRLDQPADITLVLSFVGPQSEFDLLDCGAVGGPIAQMLVLDRDEDTGSDVGPDVVERTTVSDALEDAGDHREYELPATRLRVALADLLQGRQIGALQNCLEPRKRGRLQIGTEPRADAVG